MHPLTWVVLVRVVLVSFALGGCTAPSPGATTPRSTAPAAARESSAAVDVDVTKTTDKFTFLVSIRSNLFHLLLNWASLNSGEAPPWTPDIAERDAGLDAYPAKERAAFERALQVFEKHALGRNITFDAGLHAVRAYAAGALGRDLVPDADHVLVDAVEASLPFFRKHWWHAHRDKNLAWIDAMIGTLTEVEHDMTTGLAKAYGASWPSSRVPIDIVVHAVPVGAYSAAGRVTMSSTRSGYEMPWSIEMVLHESSHLSELEPKLRSHLVDAFRAESKALPERLWHDVIFYTSAVVADVAFTALDPGTRYRHYGDATGMYERGKDRWEAMRPILDDTWNPFVRTGDGDADARRAALRAFAKRLGVETAR